MAEIRLGLEETLRKTDLNLERHRTTIQTLKIIMKEIEGDCPCGAGHGPHPHTEWCAVKRAFMSIKLCEDNDR